MPISDEDKDFATAVRDLIGLAPEDIATRLELLDADEILNLTDAVTKKDRVRANSIIRTATDSATKKISDAMNSKTASATDNEPENESDAGVTYSIGDKVTVGDKEGIVRIPSGPNDTIGVVIDGKTKMVDRDKVRRLDEESSVVMAGDGGFRIADLLAAAGVRTLAHPQEVPGEVDHMTTNRMRSLAGLPTDVEYAATAGYEDTTYIEIQPAMDPDEAANAACAAIQTLSDVLPFVRLADLKDIRANLTTLQMKMHEGAAPRKSRF